MKKYKDITRDDIIYFRLTPDYGNQLRELCGKEKRTISNQVALIVEKALDTYQLPVSQEAGQQ
jgi:hypothetical protein